MAEGRGLAETIKELVREATTCAQEAVTLEVTRLPLLEKDDPALLSTDATN